MNESVSQEGAKNILVVDDAPTNLRLLLGILSRAGYNVRPLPSGKQALAAARAQRPDLILLDVNMPERNGFEVAQELKEDPLTAEIPIIFISANDDLDSKVKGFGVGGVDYIVKPFQEAEVVARVKTHLTLIELQQEIIIKSIEAERAKLLSTFIDKASHEFRTPLSTISMNADLLLRTQAKPESQPKYIYKIKEGCKQIDVLLQNMLLMVELDGGEPFSKKRILLLPLLQELAGSFDDERLSLNLLENDLEVKANASLLIQALTELLNNAQQYTPATGHIALEMRRQGDEILIIIQDDGEGIREEHLPHIFELFYRADKAHTTRGFGLGLPIAQRIIEQHNGRLSIKTTPDNGTQAIVTLPLFSAA